MHACDACDTGLILGRDMFVLGALVEDGDDFGQFVSGDPTFELSLLAECMSAIHWSCHVEVPNSNCISC